MFVASRSLLRAAPIMVSRSSCRSGEATLLWQHRHLSAVRQRQRQQQSDHAASHELSFLTFGVAVAAAAFGVSIMAPKRPSAMAASSVDDNVLTTFRSRVPVYHLVPPGVCQFTDKPQAVELLQKARVNHNTSLFRFACPNRLEPLNLSTCACLLAKANVMVEGQQKLVVRPYTPISTNSQVGSFDLLVKHYEGGKMSQHFLRMNVGDTLEFQHVERNLKIQYPFKAQKIGMIVGGTGITPMIQALHAILGDKTSKAKVTLLYGSRTSEDILGKEVLDSWLEKYPDRFQVVYVLSEEPSDSEWEGRRGFISRKLIEQTLPPPSEGSNAMIFVCGPPALYEIYCGGLDDPILTGILDDVGYKESQVYKF